MALLLGACASTPAPREYRLSSSTVQWDDLFALADFVRSGGGALFVGTIGSVAETSPEVVTTGPEPGLYVAYPRVVANIAVTDDLGAILPASVDVIGSDGPPVIVDEAGTVRTDWVISGTLPELHMHDWMPEEGTHLFFTFPQPEGDLVVWWTSVADGMASGDGTRSGMDVPLDDLRTF